MKQNIESTDSGKDLHDSKHKYWRADAVRNNCALLQSALNVFSTIGVDAPIREIAKLAGVGVGTVYRHFPQRSDLILAVIDQEIESCTKVAETLAFNHTPSETLTYWIQNYIDFILSKPGLAAALYSTDPAYETLNTHFEMRFIPIIERLLHDASTAGEISADIMAGDLLNTVSSLCLTIKNRNSAAAKDIVSLLVDGLRYRMHSDT